jgi:hypothetical protein
MAESPTRNTGELANGWSPGPMSRGAYFSMAIEQPPPMRAAGGPQL